MGGASNRQLRAARHPATPIDSNRSGLAHELANLVQVVSGNLELIAVRTTDPNILRYVENARSAAEQLTTLTRKLRGEDS